MSQINHRGTNIDISMGPDGSMGEVTSKIKGWVGDIMYGRSEHEWGIVIPEEQ